MPQPPSPEELTEAQVHELTADLRALETELADTLERTTEEGKPVDLDEPIGRLSRMDAIAQREVSKAGRRQQTRELSDVRAALAAAASEEYGLCRSCDEPIGYRRLKARPHTPVCLRCQSERERA